MKLEEIQNQVRANKEKTKEEYNGVIGRVLESKISSITSRVTEVSFETVERLLNEGILEVKIPIVFVSGEEAATNINRTDKLYLPEWVYDQRNFFEIQEQIEKKAGEVFEDALPIVHVNENKTIVQVSFELKKS